MNNYSNYTNNNYTNNNYTNNNYSNYTNEELILQLQNRDNALEEIRNIVDFDDVESKKQISLLCKREFLKKNGWINVPVCPTMGLIFPDFWCKYKRHNESVIDLSLFFHAGYISTEEAFNFQVKMELNEQRSQLLGILKSRIIPG